IERLPFIKSMHAHGAYKGSSVIDQMMEYIDRGINIIVEFGNFTSTFTYLLVANIITRAVHRQYIKKTELFLGSQRKEDEPKKLMITIEEAHKFLNPQAARQTIFGTIAREMRKYYVSLLVVDQRPSGIDPEILSQIGTKVIAQLSDEKDIQAVLTGVSNAISLRSVLASLDSKKQALLLGHALAMPVVIQTREYDEEFYRAMSANITAKHIDEFIAEMF
ncbi:MAG: ATP-binding protein, partial [Candidatus Babeliales bacterium]|nr:ATP-binding protein [Candidatus Babeliales bacterium]